MGNAVKYLFKFGSGLLKSSMRCVSSYSGLLPDLEKVKSEIKQYDGGKIGFEMDDESGVAIITLDYPEKKNALSGRMMVELEAAIGRLEKWERGKGVLVCGGEGGFCSGGDLDFVRKMASPDNGFKMSTLMTHSLTRLQRLPIISVAFIHGSGALGGGAEISVACDFRLIEPASRIGFVHSRMGIIPAWGGNLRLSNIVGKTKALKLIVTGKILKPEEALEYGLVDGIVESKKDAMSWLKGIISLDSCVTRASKAAVLAQDLEAENRIFAPLFGGTQNKKAMEQNIKHKI